MPSIYNTVLVQNECNAGNDTIYKAFVNIGKIVRIDSYRILLEIFFVYSEHDLKALYGIYECFYSFAHTCLFCNLATLSLIFIFIFKEM